MSNDKPLKCRVWLLVKGGLRMSDQARLYRDIELPCQPVNGLYVYDGGWDATLREFAVDLRTGALEAFVQPDTMIYDLLRNRQEPIETLEEVVEQYLSDGWERKESTLQREDTGNGEA